VITLKKRVFVTVTLQLAVGRSVSQSAILGLNPSGTHDDHIKFVGKKSVFFLSWGVLSVERTGTIMYISAVPIHITNNAKK
jgi:hypothetical protein